MRPQNRGPEGRILRAKKFDLKLVIAAAKLTFSDLDVSSVQDDQLRFNAASARAYVLQIRTRRVHAKKTVRTEIEDREEVSARVAELIEQHHRFVPSVLKRQIEDEAFKRRLEGTTLVSSLTKCIVALSDIQRAIVEPWDHDVFRQFGIVALPNGYPATLPVLRSNEMLGHLPDERQYLVLRKQTYTIPDHDGDLHEVVGPASKADGTVDATVLRAFKGMGVATLNKLRESLPPPSRRRIGSRFGPEWPYPTRLAGGRPGRDGIDIRVYLQAEHFGVAPDSEDDLEDPEDPAFPEPPAGES